MPQSNLIEKDVFLSYSRVDSALVDRLRRHLEDEEKLRVWHDQGDIPVGGRTLEKIEEGLRTSQTVVAILSRAALESEWVRTELSIRTVQYIQDKTRRLIPVLIDDAEEEMLPPSLRILNYLDFRGIDFTDPLTFRPRADQLARQIRELRPSPQTDVVAMPFVVLAMTSAQVGGLWSGEVLGHPKARVSDAQSLARLKDALRVHGIESLDAYYGEHPEDWKPVEFGGMSMRSVVAGIAERFNAMQAPGSPLIQYQFFSSDFLSPDHVWRNRTWSRLSETGCVVVVDAISLFHPGLRDHFVQSQIQGSERSSIVIVSPYGSASLPINQMLEQEAREQFQRAFNRYENLDILCEFGAAELRTLQRWLLSILPRTSEFVRSSRPDPGRLADMRERMGEKPRGISGAWMGGGR